MYFDSVLFYLATLINDISLMNFSNPLAALLISLRLPISVSPWSVSSKSQFQSAAFQSFFIPWTTPSFRLPVFGIAKVEIFLVLSSFFLNFFFSCFQRLTAQQKKYNLYSFISSNHPSANHPLCFPSSEAGCKSRKNIYPRKLSPTTFNKKKLNSLKNNKKKLKKLLKINLQVIPAPSPSEQQRQKSRLTDN